MVCDHMRAWEKLGRCRQSTAVYTLRLPDRGGGAVLGGEGGGPASDAGQHNRARRHGYIYASLLNDVENSKKK